MFQKSVHGQEHPTGVISSSWISNVSGIKCYVQLQQSTYNDKPANMYTMDLKFTLKVVSWSSSYVTWGNTFVTYGA